jgi:hypothetical protein
MTLPGYGRSLNNTNNTLSVTAQRCPIGSFNAGGNSMDCQRCAPGLTTKAEGATAASMCGELNYFHLLQPRWQTRTVRLEHHLSYETAAAGWTLVLL